MYQNIVKEVNTDWHERLCSAGTALVYIFLQTHALCETDINFIMVQHWCSTHMVDTCVDSHTCVRKLNRLLENINVIMNYVLTTIVNIIRTQFNILCIACVILNICNLAATIMVS